MLLGTSLAITQPRRLPSAAPFTPASTSPLVYWDGVVGHLGAFKDNPPTVLCADGDACETLKGLYGTTLNAVQLTALNRPNATTTGLQFDTGGVDFLTPASDIVLDISVGFTIVGVVNVVGINLPLLGSLVAGSFFGILGGSTTLADDNTTELQSTNISGLGAIWVDCDSSANATMRCTGDGGTPQTTTFSANCTFNQFGNDTNLGLTNDDNANRYLNVWVIPRRIAYGSAEQLNIAAWLLSTFGVSLP